MSLDLFLARVIPYSKSLGLRVTTQLFCNLLIITVTHDRLSLQGCHSFKYWKRCALPVQELRHLHILQLYDPAHTMDAETLPNGTDTAEPLHGSGMPLTEYSATPLSKSAEKSKASAAIPPEFLLPNGFPDVRFQLQSPKATADRHSIFDSYSHLESMMSSKRRLSLRLST